MNPVWPRVWEFYPEPFKWGRGKKDGGRGKERRKKKDKDKKGKKNEKKKRTEDLLDEP